MEFHQIRYFLAASETLNFTSAAKRSNVSQPTLTRAIQKLEDEFGGPLFRRERNRTHLTDLGKVMLEYLGQVDVAAQDALGAAQKMLSLEKAPLNVGIMCTIGASRIVQFLSEFQILHPGVDLYLHDVTLLGMADELLSGDLDCVFLGYPIPVHDRFDAITLYEESMGVIFPPTHRFAKQNLIPLRELAGERYLDRLKCEFRQIFFDLLAEQQIVLSVNCRSEREYWIQNMVLKGMGVCLLPENSIILEGLEYRPILEPKLHRAVEIVTIAGHKRSPALQAFIGKTIAYRW
jgi:LysR family hydrogen peroxide-inducible transcriptional activator